MEKLQQIAQITKSTKDRTDLWGKVIQEFDCKTIVLSDESITALKSIANESLDFAYIDGEHTLRGINSDTMEKVTKHVSCIPHKKAKKLKIFPSGKIAKLKLRYANR